MRPAARIAAAALSTWSLALALGPRAAAQAPAPSPSPAAVGDVFPSGIDQVTVDVVVVDHKGQPVPGLTRNDFTVLDEGRPQDIVSFDQVRATPATSGAAAAPRRAPLATNVAQPAENGRLFVIVYDDLHLSPLGAQRAKKAVTAFVDQGTQAGDRVLLLATGGGAWWSTRLPEGRDDLIAVLKHLDGRRIPENARERLTDYEAVQIAVYRNVEVAARVQERFERYGTTSRNAMQEAQAQTQQAGFIDTYVEQRAQEAYVTLRGRMGVTFGVLERCFEALAGNRERKAVLLVSEGFAYDNRSEPRRRAVEGARRANAAVYFIDTRGLEGLSTAYSAEFGEPFAAEDLMAAVADVSREGDGAAAFAGDTGGFSVRDTNDFAGGAVRIGRESSSYYLLGYNPGDIPRDGRFRKIEVRVRGKGLTVRARRGYYAPDASGKPPAPLRAQTDPELQRALDSPGAVPGIPLRLTAYVMQDAGTDRARVVLAAEADIAKLPFPDSGGRALGTLDTLLVVAHRESEEFLRSDQKAELERRPAPPGTPVWYGFTREFEVRPGAHQAKLIVRDAQSGRLGSAILEFDVPPLHQLRVSTPILTGTLQPTPDGGYAPAMRARREFPATGQLYCGFDVFSAAKGPDGLPRVVAGYELRRGGTVVGRAQPNPIRPTSIGALSRILQFPLDGQVPGEYELRLTVTDQLSGETRELVEPFSVLPAPAARAGGR